MQTQQRFLPRDAIITGSIGQNRSFVPFAPLPEAIPYFEDIFGNPIHPYTIGLLRCIPRLDEEEGRKLVPIDGLPPNLIGMPDTCAFLPRCDYKIQRCQNDPWPSLSRIEGGHYAACYVRTKEKISELTTK